MTMWPHTVISMPPRGVDMVDGIPVVLKDGIMYSFQSGTVPIRLGTYSSNVAKWEISESLTEWLNTYQANLSPRTRKA